MIPEIPETWVLVYFHELISDHVLTYRCRRCRHELHFGIATPSADVAFGLRCHLRSVYCATRDDAEGGGS